MELKHGHANERPRLSPRGPVGERISTAVDNTDRARFWALNRCCQAQGLRQCPRGAAIRQNRRSLGKQAPDRSEAVLGCRDVLSALSLQESMEWIGHSQWSPDVRLSGASNWVRRHLGMLRLNPSKVQWVRH